MKMFRLYALMCVMGWFVVSTQAQTLENGVGSTVYLSPLDSKFAIGETNAGISKMRISGTNQIDLAINALAGIADFTFQQQGTTRAQVRYSLAYGFEFMVDDNNVGGGGVGLQYSALRIMGSNQYVGIGMGELGIPAARLHVKNSGNELMRLETESSTWGWLTFHNSSGYQAYMGMYNGDGDDIDFGTGGGNSTGDVHLVTNADPKMTVKANGDVGVGTTTPENDLSIVRSGESAALGIKTTSASSSAGIVMETNETANDDFTIRKYGSSASGSFAGSGLDLANLSAITTGVSAGPLYMGTIGNNPVYIAAGNDIGLYMADDQDIGLNSETPGAQLDVQGDEDDTQTVINATVNYTASADVSAVRGTSVPNPGFGYGGNFTGGYRGVYGYGQGTTYTGNVRGVYGFANGTAGTRYGVYGQAGGSSGTVANYGVYGIASGLATTNYGLYGSANGGTTNWAGYFVGNTRVQNGTLGLWNTGGSDGLHLALTDSGDHIHFVHDSTTDTLMTINGHNERIGIRNTDPTYTMDVRHISGVPGATAGNGLTIRNQAGSGDDHWTLYNWSSGNFSLYKAGTLRGTFSGTDGNYTPTSDRRLKSDIVELPSQMDKIMKLKPSTYNFKAQEGKEKSYGLIAQEVREIYPELAPIIESTTEGAARDLYGVTYTEFVPVLIKGIQELNGAVEEKDEAIEELTNQVALLEDKLDKIENLDAVLAQVDALDDKLKDLENVKNEIETLKNDLQSCCLGSNTGSKEVSTSTTVVDLSDKDRAVLEQNAPNPFNKETNISFYIPEKVGKAHMVFSDMNGKELRTVNINDRGFGQVFLSAGELSVGTYLYTLFVDGKKVATKQMVLTR